MNERHRAAGELLHLSGKPMHHPDAKLPDTATRNQWSEGHASQPSPLDAPGSTQQPHKKARGLNNAGPNPCHLCGKTYERVDHLSRHLKSHDNARPFQCTQCAKGFNRADLLRRHKAIHDSDEQTSVKRASSYRAVQACKACAASKSKCEDQKPCFRCQDRMITCEYPEVTHDLPPPQYNSELEALSAHFNDDLTTQSQTQQSITKKERSYSEVRQPATDNEVHLLLHEQQTQRMLQSQTDLQPVLKHNIAESRRNVPMTNNPTYFPSGVNSVFSFDWHENMMFPVVDPNFGQDLELQFSNLDWDANQYSGAFLPVAVRDQETEENGSVILRHEAFKRSPWFWVPTSKDHVFARQVEALSISEDNSVASPDYISSPDIRLVDERVDQAVRDKIFALVIAEDHKVAPVLSFPSAELLDNLLHVFFIQDSYQSDRFIHVTSFKTSKVIPELLLSIISAGSTFISDPAIWKMGLALQEFARRATTYRIETNNSSSRELATLQAYMLWVDVGSWSGFNRLMEIAEANEQPLLTMLRRAGALNRTRYPDIRPDHDDAGDVLETKWMTWVKHESFKRLVLHLFMHDMQNSITNRVNPLISYVEMTLPLPASRKLWNAKTAEDWKSNILETYSVGRRQTPSLADCLHNISSLELSRDYIDVQMSCLAILFGHWGQIWTYNESRQFLSKGPRPTSQLRLTSQQQELFQDLQSLCSSIQQITRVSNYFDMVSQLFMMSLYVSIEELQLFAGKSGEEESRRANPIIRNWIDSPDSRHAAWHAGQVLRAARNIPPTQLRGFYAIGVYHASLTLWVYGLASRAARKRGIRESSISTALTSTIPVPLDSNETHESRAFLHFGQGSPGLTVHHIPETDFGSVEDSQVLMATARQILRSNFTQREEPLPLLVETLGNLMRDLGDLATVPNLQIGPVDQG